MLLMDEENIGESSFPMVVEERIQISVGKEDCNCHLDRQNFLEDKYSTINLLNVLYFREIRLTY